MLSVHRIGDDTLGLFLHLNYPMEEWGSHIVEWSERWPNLLLAFKAMRNGRMERRINMNRL